MAPLRASRYAAFLAPCPFCNIEPGRIWLESEHTVAARCLPHCAPPHRSHGVERIRPWHCIFVDDRDLVVTNQHAVGPSEYIAVRIDDEYKVAASLLAAAPEKDVAVLLTSLHALPGAIVAPLEHVIGQPLAMEGERVIHYWQPPLAGERS